MNCRAIQIQETVPMQILLPDGDKTIQSWFRKESTTRKRWPTDWWISLSWRPTPISCKTPSSAAKAKNGRPASFSFPLAFYSRWTRYQNDLFKKFNLIMENVWQITVGFLLIFGSYIQSKLDSATNSELQGDADQQPNIQAQLFWINLINHATIGLVFLVAVINIFIASFTHS